MPPLCNAVAIYISCIIIPSHVTYLETMIGGDILAFIIKCQNAINDLVYSSDIKTLQCASQ